MGGGGLVYLAGKSSVFQAYRPYPCLTILEALITAVTGHHFFFHKSTYVKFEVMALACSVTGFGLQNNPSLIFIFKMAHA